MPEFYFKGLSGKNPVCTSVMKALYESLLENKRHLQNSFIYKLTKNPRLITRDLLVHG